MTRERLTTLVEEAVDRDPDAPIPKLVDEVMETAAKDDFEFWIVDQVSRIRQPHHKAICTRCGEKMPREHRSGLCGFCQEEEAKESGAAPTAEVGSFLERAVESEPPSELSGQELVLARDKLKPLLRSTFQLTPGGEPIAWGEATVHHHRQRLALLQVMRRKVDSTMERHEIAIATLDATGARCLDDVEPGTQTALPPPDEGTDPAELAESGHFDP